MIVMGIWKERRSSKSFRWGRFATVAPRPRRPAPQSPRRASGFYLWAWLRAQGEPPLQADTLIDLAIQMTDGGASVDQRGAHLASPGVANGTEELTVP